MKYRIQAIEKDLATVRTKVSQGVIEKYILIAKKILRILFAIVSVLYFVFILIELAVGEPIEFALYIPMMGLYYVQIPGLFVLFIIAAYRYLYNKPIWNFLKKEILYFSITIILLGSFILIAVGNQV